MHNNVAMHIHVFTAGAYHLTTQVLISPNFVEDTIMTVNILLMEALKVVHKSRF